MCIIHRCAKSNYLCHFYRYRERKWKICATRYIKSKESVYADGAGKAVTLPGVYKKLPKNSSMMTSGEENCFKNAKHNHAVFVSTDAAVNTSIDKRSNATGKVVLHPPLWDIDMDSVTFTRSKV